MPVEENLMQAILLTFGTAMVPVLELRGAIYSPDMLVGRFHYRIDTLLPIDFTGKKGH